MERSFDDSPTPDNRSIDPINNPQENNLLHPSTVEPPTNQFAQVALGIGIGLLTYKITDRVTENPWLRIGSGIAAACLAHRLIDKVRFIRFNRRYIKEDETLPQSTDKLEERVIVIQPSPEPERKVHIEDKSGYIH